MLHIACEELEDLQIVTSIVNAGANVAKARNDGKDALTIVRERLEADAGNVNLKAIEEFLAHQSSPQ